MNNIETINKLQNELAEIVQKEFNALETMSLIPEEVKETENSVFFDWLYDCVILQDENKFGNIYQFYIVDIVRRDTALKFIGRNTQDYTDIQEFYPFEFTLDQKIRLLNCVNDVKNYSPVN